MGARGSSHYKLCLTYQEGLHAFLALLVKVFHAFFVFVYKDSSYVCSDHEAASRSWFFCSADEVASVYVFCSAYIIVEFCLCFLFFALLTKLLDVEMVSCSSAHVVRLFYDFCKAYELLCSAIEAASCFFFLDVLLGF